MDECRTYPPMEELLSRYCEGNVTDEEREKVEKWIGQSDEHYKMTRDIFLLYLASDTLDMARRVDSEKAFHRVKARMRSRRLKIVWLQCQRIAAILFIPLLIAYLIELFAPSDDSMRMLEVRTNPGMTTRLILPDGTKVCLNSESSLVYPERFEGHSRQVSLQGEAFFEVNKNPDKRFVVQTPHNAQIEVLGTSFNVETFACDSFISTTLINGKVNFITDTRSFNLHPGEKLIYNVKNRQADVYQTTGELETSWKEGKIIFRNTPFDEALRILEKRYHVEFVIANTKYEKDAFTGSFTGQRLERILEIFKISSGINWRYLSSEDKMGEKSKIEIY